MSGADIIRELFVAIHQELAARAEAQFDIAQACLEALARHEHDQ